VARPPAAAAAAPPASNGGESAARAAAGNPDEKLITMNFQDIDLEPWQSSSARSPAAISSSTIG
jgi:hypothetical protein